MPTVSRLAYINVLRAIAIIAVLVLHTAQQGSALIKMHPLAISLISQGGRGVQLFFILSAFTLYRSYNERRLTDGNPVRNFYIRRFFRIAPMYYLAIIYYLFLYGTGVRPWNNEIKYVSLANIISNFTFTHGVSPYWINSIVPGGWSVAIEMIFYFIFPFLFSLIRNTRQAFNLLLYTSIIRIVVLAVMNRITFGVPFGIWDDYLFLFFPNQFPVFSLGILMYFIISDNYNLKISSKSAMLFSLLVLLELIYNNEFFLSNFLLFSIALLIFILALSKCQPGILVNDFLSHIGKISYSMYLIHFGVLYWLKKYHFIDFLVVNNSTTALENYFIRFFIVFISTMLLSTIFYHLVEQPFIKKGESIINRK